MIECKNYGKEIGNPELDQMVGRLDPNRGKFGMIVCRSLTDEALFLQRCADSYKSQHGIIVPITDVDVIGMLTELKSNRPHPEDALLTRRFREIAQR